MLLGPDSPASQRLPEILRRLKKIYPEARCAFDYTAPFELLVATILAAQCSDELVKQVAPALFARWPTAEALAQAERSDVEEVIHPLGHGRQKARFIGGIAHVIVQEHAGKVPSDMGALLKMPGLSRNIANIVLNIAFGLVEGIAVDSHVKRLAKRLALTNRRDTNKVERDLMALAPREDWLDLAYLCMFHGQRVCKARKPNCAACVLDDLCPSTKK
jgi:endonuclease-3